MTEKEKAKELFNKYYSYLKANLMDDKEAIDDAKQCALIAVDEIINSNPYKFVPFLDYTDCTALESNIKYFQKVKQEIEKL